MTATCQGCSPEINHRLPLLEIRRLSLRSNQLPILQPLPHSAHGNHQDENSIMHRSRQWRAMHFSFISTIALHAKSQLLGGC